MSSCQQAKLPLPQKAPLKSVPIGQMIAIDILKIPMSTNSNRVNKSL